MSTQLYDVAIIGGDIVDYTQIRNLHRLLAHGLEVLADGHIGKFIKDLAVKNFGLH